MPEFITRRRWFSALVRYLFVGALSLLSVVLVRRRWSDRCDKPLGTCRDCTQIVHCVLPQAKIQRRAQKG